MTIAEFVWRRYRGYLGQTTSTRTILVVIEKRGLTSLLRDPSQRLLTTSGEWCGSKTQRPLLWFVFINRALAILWCKNSHDFSGPWLGVKFFSPLLENKKFLSDLLSIYERFSQNRRCWMCPSGFTATDNAHRSQFLLMTANWLISKSDRRPIKDWDDSFCRNEFLGSRVHAC